MKTIDLEEIRNIVIEKLGGPASVGNMLGVSSQAISQWKVIPIDRVLQIEISSAGSAKCCEMRPDIFPNCPHDTPSSPILPVPNLEQQEKELPKVSAPKGTKKRRERDERRREPVMAE